MRNEEAFATGLIAGAVAVFVWLLTPPRPKPVAPAAAAKQIPPPYEDLDEYVGFDREFWNAEMSR